jgi:hypothetical protein
MLRSRYWKTKKSSRDFLERRKGVNETEKDQLNQLFGPTVLDYQMQMRDILHLPLTAAI